MNSSWDSTVSGAVATGADGGEACAFLWHDVVPKVWRSRLAFSPVFLVGDEGGVGILHVLLDFVRARTDHLGLEIRVRAVRQNSCVAGGEHGEERTIALVQVEGDGELIGSFDGLNWLELTGPDTACIWIHEALEAEYNVLSGEWVSVMEGDTLAQGKDVGCVVWLLPAFGEDRHGLAIVIKDDEGFVNSSHQLEAGGRCNESRIPTDGFLGLADDDGIGCLREHVARDGAEATNSGRDCGALQQGAAVD